ncbi:hypothetical protein C9374_011112 [Naegleria lovaniensis]|uniref:Uncharacterized protein n=1 Tax=Naegleria lovaniensis TaxID=51637 RepID=A0AA88GF41_NAELO|nr:uncharacterized protein C9374_011112 [Naegleria lovaniensis]KAG2374033.1 hypothetical protein C9374_011112 [Naegleria lovaniensis]
MSSLLMSGTTTTTTNTTTSTIPSLTSQSNSRSSSNAAVTFQSQPPPPLPSDIDKKDLPPTIEKYLLMSRAEVLQKVGDRIPTTFCEENGLQKETFLGMLEGKERYITGRFALLKHLIRLEENYEIVSKDYFTFLYQYDIAWDWERIKAKIVEKTFHAFQKLYHDMKFVIFMDGDNLSTDFSLEGLSTFSKSIIQVVAVFANGVVNEGLMGFEKQPWFSIMHSTTKKKDAADTCLTLLIGSLHTHLALKLPDKEVVFIVVTKDHFADELSEQLRIANRDCIRVSTPNDLRTFLSQPYVPLSRRSKSTASSTSSSSSIHTTPAQIEITTLKVIPNPSYELLTSFFNLYWIGNGKSQSLFCKNNNLDSSNFSKHLRRKKFNTACHKKIEELYNTILETSNNEKSVYLLKIGDKVDVYEIFHSTSNSKEITSVTLSWKNEQFSYCTPHMFEPSLNDDYPVCYETYGKKIQFIGTKSSNNCFWKTKEKCFLQLNVTAVAEHAVTVPLFLQLSGVTEPKQNYYVDVVLKHNGQNVEIELEGPTIEVNSVCKDRFTYSLPPNDVKIISTHLQLDPFNFVNVSALEQAASSKTLCTSPIKIDPNDVILGKPHPVRIVKEKEHNEDDDTI